MCKQIPIVKGSFVRCQNRKCRKWIKLGKPDETGMTTIPLFNALKNGKEIWLCNDCWEENDRRQNENE